MDEVNGVFLQSRNLDSEFMIKCMQVLVNNFPAIRVTSVESDELHFGYKVYFSSPNADMVLARKSLLVAGRDVRIGPLRSLLTIYGVRKNGGLEYETELRMAICNKFGKWLKEDSVSGTFIQKNLRVWVDVPELEDLEIFRNEMFLCLPESNERFEIQFHCRRCDRDGHVLQNCSFMLDDEPGITDTSNNSDSSFTENRDDETDISDVSEVPNTLFTFRSENRDFSSTASNFRGVFSHSTTGPSQTGSHDRRDVDIGLKRASRSAFFGPTAATTMEVENTTPAPTTAFGVATTTAAEVVCRTPTHAAGVGITNTSPIPTTTVKFMDAAPTPTTAVGIMSTNPTHATAGGFANITLTPATVAGLPAPATTAGFADITPTPSTSAGFTNTAPTPSTSAGFTNTAPTPAEVTRTLSLRLQGIIDIACRKINVIDRVHLDNFLFFVKGKSTLLQCAKKYTYNVEKLIDLLRVIISLHYNTPPLQALTEQDKAFIKRLEGLVNRFDENTLWRDSEGMF